MDAPGSPLDTRPAGFRTVTAAVVLVLAASVGGAVLLLDQPSVVGPDTGAGRRRAPLIAAEPVAATSSSTTTTTLPAPTTTTVDPGTLPQTMDKPTATDVRFQAGISALWDAIVRNDPAAASSFFFPLTAYQQVKSISDPAQDYRQRLLANYAADIATLHGRLGVDATSAVLAGVDVPDQAQWILPGVEYNKGSYWRVYGTTLRYTVNGAVRTFPITSMISWRGEWYVVHLGAIR